MAIFLDYYRGKGENISDVAVREDGRTKYYRFRGISEAINHLAGRELIVTFERPYGPFKRSMEGYEHLLKDMNVRERWFDIQKELRKETGKAITLSRIVKATLGDPDDLKIVRLEPAEDDWFRADLKQLMESRLLALEAVFKHAIDFDQLSFQIGDATEWAEIIINENIDLD